jgi:membrane-associated phospholipid phosphatase
MLSLAWRILGQSAGIVAHGDRNGSLRRQRRHHVRSLLLAGVLPFAAAGDVAAQQPSAPDTAKTEVRAEEAPPDFLWGHARSTLAVAVLATIAIAPFDRPIQSAMQSKSLQQRAGLRQAADMLAYAGGQGPFYLGGASYVVGRIVRSERLADLGLHLTEGAALAAGIGALGKGIAGRQLPDARTSDSPGSFSFGRGFHAHSGQFVSFPAGHAGVSFASAAVITSEVGRWRPDLRWKVGAVTYGAATLIAVARVYQNRHWASDNPIAAVIGTWSGLTVVRRQHFGPRSRLDRLLLGLHAAPTGQGGFAVAWSPDLAAP